MFAPASGSRSRVLIGVCLGAVIACAAIDQTAAAEPILPRLEQDVTGSISDLSEDVREEVAFIWGMEAYAYGLPLVLMDVTKGVLTAASNPSDWSAPINQFTRAQAFVTPAMLNVVRISLNGLWATSFLDLKEPIILSVPNAGDRAYVGQVMNMWTNDFAAFGPRVTGNKAANFMIVGPDWQGKKPADIKEVYRSTTPTAWILIQTIVHGPKDFPAGRALQAKYQLTPLSAWGKPYQPPRDVAIDPSVDTQVTPFNQVRLMDAQSYFGRLAALLGKNPPYPADKPMLDKLSKLGIEAGKPFDIASVDPAVGRGLTKAVAEIWGRLSVGPLSMKTVNGWMNGMDLGAYGTNYDTRAAVAWMGLGALRKGASLYPTAFLDGEGRPLDFMRSYTMTFPKDQMLPCKQAWSISIYQGNFYSVNAANKYDVAPWMQPKLGDDGSLTIYVQKESPGADLEPNWLPSTQAGPMNLTIRCYDADPSFLDGSYRIPPLVLTE